jgi:four helix bundle protein
MRDHKKLHAFKLADELILTIYKTTKNFPKEEQFCLTLQLRRAVVSIASNIVEGCARNSEADYLHFLDMAYGSAREVEYQVTLANKLGYLSLEDNNSLTAKCEETSKVLNGLIRSLRGK